MKKRVKKMKRRWTKRGKRERLKKKKEEDGKMEKIKKEEQERVDILLTDQRQPSNHVIKMRHYTLLDTL